MLVVGVVLLVHLARLRRPVGMRPYPRPLHFLRNVARYLDPMRRCLPHVDHVVLGVVQVQSVEGLVGDQVASQPAASRLAVVATGLAAAFAKPSSALAGCVEEECLVVGLEVVLAVERRQAGLPRAHDARVLAAAQR